MEQSELKKRIERILEDEENRDAVLPYLETAIQELNQENEAKANDLVESMEGNILYYNFVTEAEARKIVDGFINTDGTKGEKWDASKFFKKMEDLGWETDNKPCFNKWALWVTANMFYSDHGNVFAKFFGDDQDKYLEAIYDFAVARLSDPDRPRWIRTNYSI